MREEPLDAAHLRRHMLSVAAKGHERADKAILSLGLKVLNSARKKVVEGGRHAYGTPTPASPGRGPAGVTYQLRGSLDKEVRIKRGAMVVRVGPRDTERRQSGKGARRRMLSLRARGGSSTNGVIGAALETGGRYGVRYPWLYPAFKEGTKDHKGAFMVTFSKGDWH